MMMSNIAGGAADGRGDGGCDTNIHDSIENNVVFSIAAAVVVVVVVVVVSCLPAIAITSYAKELYRLKHTPHIVGTIPLKGESCATTATIIVFTITITITVAIHAGHHQFILGSEEMLGETRYGSLYRRHSEITFSCSR